MGTPDFVWVTFECQECGEEITETFEGTFECLHCSASVTGTKGEASYYGDYECPECGVSFAITRFTHLCENCGNVTQFTDDSGDE